MPEVFEARLAAITRSPESQGSGASTKGGSHRALAVMHPQVELQRFARAIMMFAEYQPRQGCRGRKVRREPWTVDRLVLLDLLLIPKDRCLALVSEGNSCLYEVLLHGAPVNS